jgi:hypothetical protein
MTVDGVFYPLKTWERITVANDGGYWPTPTVNMVSGGANHESPMVKQGQHGINLKGAVMKWPTPRAGNPGSRPNGKGGKILSEEVKKYPTPCARDWKDNGKSPSELARNSETLATTVGGQLNPTWVEWLMGYPSEWTVLEDWAIAWFRLKHEKPLKD